MNSRQRLSLRSLAVIVCLSIVASMACSPKYVARVYWHRGADFGDIHKFPASVIGASGTPSKLPVELDPSVARTLEFPAEITTLESFLEGSRTTAFLVVQRGRVILEFYFGEHSVDSMQNTFSVSKSVMSALVGLAVRDSVLRLEAPITEYLPELLDRDARFNDIQVADLLNMQSGIRYSRKVSFPFVNSDDPLIYYHPNLESVVLDRTRIADTPGTFQYNNYNPPLIGLILRRTTGVSVSRYLERELWQPLGAMADAGWTTDDRGMERMESGFHARARDLARFGVLFLRQGRVGEVTVVPEDWVRSSTQLASRVELEAFDGRQWVYNAGWWIVQRPSDPADFCAIGAKGEYIYVSPQHDVVFVRNGEDKGEWGDRDWTGFFYQAAERLGQRVDATPR